MKVLPEYNLKRQIFNVQFRTIMDDALTIFLTIVEDLSQVWKINLLYNIIYIIGLQSLVNFACEL